MQVPQTADAGEYRFLRKEINEYGGQQEFASLIPGEKG